MTSDFTPIAVLPQGNRLRYTIQPGASRGLLKRLLQLNHKFHAEEEAKGLHKKRPGRTGEDDSGDQPSLL